jgi:nitrate/TMAO reductase-like tetraheme cytochrome c subunit
MSLRPRLSEFYWVVLEWIGMKTALAAALVVLALAIGFIAWIAAGIAPRAEFVPYVEPPPAPEPSYLRAVYSPLHFRPAIDTASDEQCLACHREVLDDKVRAASPAGQKAELMRAWYQQTPTYDGGQDTFHRRHLVTLLAKQLMTLRCTTCHLGHDPREEAQGAAADSARQDDIAFTLRKQVNPETTCLKCHGQFPWQLMGLPGPWEEHKATFGNNCQTCHAAIRTKRHEVNYLNAAAIEQAGKDSADACFGCHGGRTWYRIAYPYARTPWPDMPAEVPDWAKNRPPQSETRFLRRTAGKP